MKQLDKNGNPTVRKLQKREKMTTNRIIHIAIIAIMMLMTTSAYALTPSVSTMITNVSIDAPYYYKIDKSTLYIGREQCEHLVHDNSRIKITYDTRVNTLTTIGLYDNIYTFQVGRDTTARIDCSSSTSICHIVDNSKYIKQTPKQIVVDIPFKDLLTINSINDCRNLNTELFVRAQIKQRTTDTTYTESDAKFIIDSVGAAAPKLDSASATQSSLVIAMTNVSDPNIENYGVFYSQKPLTAGTTPDLSSPGVSVALFGTRDTTQASVAVTMEAGKKYYVALSSHDNTGNYGPLSNVLEVTPIKTKDFWESYLEAGGQDEGGCSSTPNPLNSPPIQLLILGTLGIVFRRRR